MGFGVHCACVIIYVYLSRIYRELALQALHNSRLSSTTDVPIVKDLPPNMCPTLDPMATVIHPLPPFLPTCAGPLGHLKHTTLDIQVTECSSKVLLDRLKNPAAF